MNLCSEFCGHKNEGLDISPEEVPKGDSFDFVLIPARTEEATEAAEGETKPELTVEKKEESKGTVVYCIDISGSMSCVVHLPELQGTSHSFSFYENMVVWSCRLSYHQLITGSYHEMTSFSHVFSREGYFPGSF